MLALRAFAASVCILAVAGTNADERTIHSFESKQLTGTYFSEGANAGDINGDGVADIVYGPYWFAGPDYEAKHEIYKPVKQDVNRYADNFFSWVHDFNKDGFNDVFVVGFPGTPAYVYENPKADGLKKHWKKHQVFDWVSNESPQLINLLGDEQPELVCTRDGFFGFATIDSSDPLGTWDFHPISQQVTAKKFGHGLGIGDINGDGRQDIIHAGGWYEQPPSKADASRWKHHPVKLTVGYGGAEMHAYDVDGDGDNDVITSERAHEFGLSWYEQVTDGDAFTFKRHQIMGSHPSENKYGVLFSEPHSVALADIDGDGLKDIVTGKTYWSHHKQSPMWDAGAVVYWFKLVRADDGVDWVPYLADGDAGIGRQVSVTDVNADGLTDIVLGGMKGAHVLTHKTSPATPEQWKAAQPRVYTGPKLPSMNGAKALRGPKSKVNVKTARVEGAIEGESLKGRTTGGATKAQDMSRFNGDSWSGKSQLWWTGAKPGDTLTLELPAFTGVVDLDVVLTCAKDYGVVQLSLDDQPLGDPIDLYETSVITTGVLSFPKQSVQGNKHTLGVQIIGANPKAAKSHMFAIDYLRIKKPDGKFVDAPVSKRPAGERNADAGERPKSRDGRVLNLGFELGTLADWTATGDGFEGQPIKGDLAKVRRSSMPSNHSGDFWIGGFEKFGDERTGTLTSEPFVVSQPYGSFLTNGGQHDTTRVELIRQDTGKVFFQVNGTKTETMRRVVVDLRGHVGKEIRIRIVDEHKGGWGHVNFDNFLLHANRPARPTPSLVALTADEYPHSGLRAQQAATEMKVPDGFHVTVGASEPAVKQPIAMALDDRGRVWIAEAYEYPVRAKGDTGRDRILIFEDTNGDGSLDSRKVFAEGLNLVSGLEVGFGGVWVGAAPYLMFIPDKDGDDVPDGEPEILLDGWGLQDTHETLNAFIWGPDGWLYGCHGVFTHSRVGKPGTPDADRIPLNCCVWRYHPTRHEFDVFANGTSNPWGVDFNDHGQAFITACVIPHLYHIIQGARYQRQGGRHFNPHTYRDIVTIADHLHYLGATPHGGNSKSNSAGGGHAHAGAMIYLGDRWPQKYRDQIFMNNIHGQRLNVDILKPNGSGYVGSHGPDFLLARDNASQILNLRYGPDGNAWMIDWYDMQACHHGKTSLHDRTNGRIYKISYGDQGFAAPTVDLAKASDLQLAEMVLHPNDWYVRHSRRVLQERAAKRPIDAAAITRLTQVAISHDDDTRRLRAAWALHVTKSLHKNLSTKLCDDASAYVRGWAVQLAMETAGDQPSANQLAKFASMAATDPSPIVRLYLTSATQKLPPESRWNLLKSLTSHAQDATDHNLPLMYWYAAEPLAEVDPFRALALAMSAGERIPLLREFMLRRIGSGGSESSLEVLVKGLGDAATPALKLTYLKAIRTALQGQRKVEAPPIWSDVSKSLLASENSEVRLQSTALGVTFGDPAAMQTMRSQIVDPSGSIAARTTALQSLLDANDRRLVPTLTRLLADAAPLREAAIRGLAQFDDASVAPSLLAAYSGLTPDQRRIALGTLCSRPGPASTLLDAIEAKKIPGADLTADLVMQLQFLNDKQVNAKLKRVWGAARESAGDKLKLIAEYKSLIESTDHPQAELETGRAVFANTCMKCHTLYGVGFKVGPDLTGSNRANLDYLLSNIVDPSSVMAKEYQPTVLLTEDGRIVSGLVKAEDKNSVSIQTTDALVVVPIDEIDDRRLGDKSMMPDDQLKQFTPHQVRSLVAYLRGKEQTPMAATPENASTFFNGTDLTGWTGTDGLWSVENGELVGRTEGLKRNEWIVSDLSADNFRLTVDVKLVDNAGNSGIQFRSKSHDDEVSGYQADIGAGWWGKLYEEHGRGLLWDKSAKQHVRQGQWNQYEIIAQNNHLRTLINGHPCVDLIDRKGATRGIIAFQLHSGGKTEVRFRKMKLEVLRQETPPAGGQQ
ncbi:PVC-type heme-binding CxxCH protein [Stieleria marina]|uniref:FG-GAP repeat protein n=1 Tax=Stieleria marina TaxID=1930275 RepID=A0A517NSS6_9BACT|nr:FG-GAP repeat protein [Planctomycetes bacterium K23_9]